MNLRFLETFVLLAELRNFRMTAYHAVGGVLTIGGLLLAELWKQPLRAPRAAATA